MPVNFQINLTLRVIAIAWVPSLVVMPLINLPRNIEVYDNSGQPSVLVAGFMQLGHTTTREFYDCLEICFQQPAPSNFRVCLGNGTVLSRANDAILVPLGDYYVISIGIELLPSILIVSRTLDIFAGCPHT